MRFRATLSMIVICLLATPFAHAGLATVGPISGMEATGDKGLITSIDGIAVEDLILGISTFAGDPKHAQYPPQDGDNFDLNLIASGDDQAYIQTMFSQSVETIYLIENNGNDDAVLQGLDAGGNPIGATLDLVKADYLKTGFKTVNNQVASGVIVTTDAPVFGIRLSPPSSGALGFDPVSVSAVVPEPMTISLLGLGAVAMLRRRRS